MPQYAHFDHTEQAPQPVLGWYDTDALHYPRLPPKADMLEMTPQQWAQRMSGRWAVNGETLVAVADPLQQQRESLGALSNMLVRKETAGVYFSPPDADEPVLFASDNGTIQKLTTLMSIIQAGLWIQGTPILAADGRPIAMSADAASSLISKILSYVQACNLRYAQLYPEVLADPATDISSGWPSNS